MDRRNSNDFVGLEDLASVERTVERQGETL